MAEVSKILEQLNTLIGEDLKVVSFKWLARHFSIPADLAKQVLFAFVEKHRSKVNATYLLGGWTKSNGARRHVFQLVDGARLPESRKRLDPLTSLHVYSVQPTMPKDPAELWNTDCQQTMELFDSMVKSLDQNCLVDNRWSAVECQAAKRNPEAARKVPVQPTAEVPAAAKPPSRIVAKVDGIMAGATAERGGFASTSIAVRGSGSSSLKTPPITASGPASVATAPSAKPAAKADPPPQTGKCGNALSTMWKKAPAKKAQKKEAATAPSAAAVDGDAAIRLAQQVQAESDSDDSDAPVTKRKATHRAAVFDDDEEEEENEEAPAMPAKQSKLAAMPAAKARGKKGSQVAATAKKKARSLQEDDSENEQEAEEEAEEEEAPGRQNDVPPAPDALWLMGLTQSNVTAPKKGKGAKDSSAQKAAPVKRAARKKAVEASLSEGVEMVLDEEAEGEAAEEAPKSCKPSFGSVKAGAETGLKRRKVTKTVINEKGEEVTETTWEEQPAGSQDSGSVPPSSQKSASAAPAAAAKPKDAKPALRDSGAAKPGKKSAPAKGKPVGQRNIMSFFQKKLPSDYEEYYKAASKPVKRPAPPASTSSPAETEVPLQPAIAGAAPAVDAVDVGLGEQQRRGAAAVTRWMLPWERAQMDGKQGPLKSWEKLYWGVFVSALAALLFGRLWGKDAPADADPKAKEEKEQRRMLAARLLLAGESLVGEGEEDAFEGLSPQEIQVYVDKVTGGASASDPFEGMSPEEINEIMSSRKLAS